MLHFVLVAGQTLLGVLVSSLVLGEDSSELGGLCLVGGDKGIDLSIKLSLFVVQLANVALEGEVLLGKLENLIFLYYAVAGLDLIPFPQVLDLHLHLCDRLLPFLSYPPQLSILTALVA